MLLGRLIPTDSPLAEMAREEVKSEIRKAICRASYRGGERIPARVLRRAAEIAPERRGRKARA